MTESNNTRKYVVLISAHRAEEDVPHLETAGGWVFVEEVTASSDKAAIAQVVGDEGGTFVAVPTRNWNPRVVTVKQRATYQFGEPR